MSQGQLYGPLQPVFGHFVWIFVRVALHFPRNCESQTNRASVTADALQSTRQQAVSLENACQALSRNMLLYQCLTCAMFSCSIAWRAGCNRCCHADVHAQKMETKHEQCAPMQLHLSLLPSLFTRIQVRACGVSVVPVKRKFTAALTSIKYCSAAAELRLSCTHRTCSPSE